MIVQTIVWTLLPDPAAEPTSDGTVTMTLLASPRLGTDDPPGVTPAASVLSDYPALASWPSVTLGVEVELVGPARTVQAPAEFVDPTPDPALWQAIFPPTQPVQPFTFAPLANVPVHTYSAGTVASSLAQQYTALLPQPVAAFAAHASPWTPIDQLLQTLGLGTSVESLPDQVTASWIALAAYHATPQPLAPRGRALPTRVTLTAAEDPATTVPEFHTVVGALADHPVLATRLGLRRRVRMTLPTGLTGPLTIQAVPTHGAALRDYRPRTRVVATTTTLTLGTSDGTPSSPYLPLDDTSTYMAIDVDTDRSGLALLAWAQQLNQADRTQPPPPLAPPALRSDGIFVATANRDDQLKATLTRSEALDADLAAGHDGGDVTLEPDDLWHGMRVDVLDEGSQQWYPLCRRQVVYTVPGGPTLPPVDDEGHVSAAVTHHGTDTQPATQVHPSLFRWNGWSLVAPPPGRMLDTNDQLADAVPPPDPTQPFHAAINPTPGTLPALRYGRSYRLRARRVDVAGAAVAFTADAATPVPSTPALTYRRYDPVPAPVCVPRHPVTPGESAYVMVIRTDNSNATAPETGLPCERLLLAPKAAVATLETHGMLDVTGQHRPDPGLYTLLFDHDDAVLTGPPDPGANGSPYVDADTAALPWLPDPQAAGATLTGPLTPSASVPWPPGPTWYQPGSLRLVLRAGETASAAADPAAGTLDVTLPPGAVTPVNLSSPLPAGGEELMGAWNWYANAATPDAVPALRAAATAGTLRALTPGITLQLVHAVRCPLQPPAFGDLQAIRSPSATSYQLSDDALQCDTATTHSVYAHLDWTDIVDDPAQPGPVATDRSADLLPSGDTTTQDAPSTFAATHPLGDTRHHELTCTPVATSRFTTFFAEHATVTLVGQTPAAVAAQVVPGTVVVRDGMGGTAYGIDRDVTVDAQHGTVARLPGSAIPDGAAVDVEFVVPPVTTAGAASTVTVLASARPAAPVVESVVPAFSWTVQTSGSTITSRRVGNYLRVYLQRPWYDSGDGELLAVLVAPEGTSTIVGTPALDVVSHFSADAVFGIGGPSGPLTRADLPRAEANVLVSIADPRLPAGSSAPQVWAMGHPVDYDPVRRLWFCDVKIAAPHPYVHLKLARLQPAAIPGLELSAIVDAGFHQPSPDRTLIVSVDGTHATIAVSGPMGWGRLTEFTAAVVTGPAPGGDPALWVGLDTLVTTPLTGDPPTNVRSATLTLPATPGSTPMRLLVQEHQVLPGSYASPGSQDPPSERGTADSRRLCYCDVVEL